MDIPANCIITGDNLKVMSSFPDGAFDAIVTDPPYGITKDDDDYVAIEWLEEAYRVLKNDSALIMCTGMASLRHFWTEAERVGFKWLNTIIWWHRNSLSRQKRSFAFQYDPILYMSKGNFVHLVDAVRIPYRSQERLKYACNNKKMKNWRPNPLGAMCPDVWEFPAVTTTAKSGSDRPVGHKWQKPLRLMERMVKCCCKEGNIMLDPFCGSGTSCLAAKMNNIKYVGIEIDPKSSHIATLRTEDDYIVECRTESKNDQDIFE